MKACRITHVLGIHSGGRVISSYNVNLNKSCTVSYKHLEYTEGHFTMTFDNNPLLDQHTDCGGMQMPPPLVILHRLTSPHHRFDV